MRFLVLGTSQFTVTCTQVLLDQGVEVAALISLPSGERQLDSIDLETFANEKGIPYHEFSDLSESKAVEILSSYQPDYIFSSWPHLLKKETINLPKNFVIGSHPAALPFNRGRHPLYWLFCLGFEETKISFFVVDERVDNGGIVAQIPFRIPQDGSVTQAFDNMSEAARVGMAQVVSNLRTPGFVPRIQDASKANYWRKRSIHDIIIDPRMSAEMIIRTVRSFAPPYPGALLIWRNHHLRIARAEIDRADYSPEEIQRLENGKVAAKEKNSILLKTGDHLLRLEFTAAIPDELQKVNYVQPPTYYLAPGFAA